MLSFTLWRYHSMLKVQNKTKQKTWSTAHFLSTFPPPPLGQRIIYEGRGLLFLFGRTCSQALPWVNMLIHEPNLWRQVASWLEGTVNKSTKLILLCHKMVLPLMSDTDDKSCSTAAFAWQSYSKDKCLNNHWLLSW